MNAADVLAERIAFWKEQNGVLGRDEARFLTEDLLAHGEQGEHRGGIYIDPDGIMWRAKLLGEDVSGHSIVVLLPLSAEAGDTDAGG